MFSVPLCWVFTEALYRAARGAAAKRGNDGRITVSIGVHLWFLPSSDPMCGAQLPLGFADGPDYGGAGHLKLLSEISHR